MGNYELVSITFEYDKLRKHTHAHAHTHTHTHTHTHIGGQAGITRQKCSDAILLQRIHFRSKYVLVTKDSRRLGGRRIKPPMVKEGRKERRPHPSHYSTHSILHLPSPPTPPPPSITCSLSYLRGPSPPLPALQLPTFHCPTSTPVHASHSLQVMEIDVAIVAKLSCMAASRPSGVWVCRRGESEREAGVVLRYITCQIQHGCISSITPFTMAAKVSLLWWWCSGGGDDGDSSDGDSGGDCGSCVYLSFFLSISFFPLVLRILFCFRSCSCFPSWLLLLRAPQQLTVTLRLPTTLLLIPRLPTTPLLIPHLPTTLQPTLHLPTTPQLLPTMPQPLHTTPPSSTLM